MTEECVLQAHAVVLSVLHRQTVDAAVIVDREMGDMIYIFSGSRLAGVD
jgi:hypothetical protein